MSQQQQNQSKTGTGRRRGLSGYLDEVAASQEGTKGTKRQTTGGGSKMAKKDKELTREEAREVLNRDIEGLQIIFGTVNNNPSDAFIDQFLTNEKLVAETGIDGEWFDTVKRLMYRSLESACSEKDTAELEKYNEEDWVKLITSMTMQQVALAESISGTLNDKTKEIIRQAVVSYVKDDSFKQDMLEMLLTLKEERDSVMEEALASGASEASDADRAEQAAEQSEQDNTVVHLITQNKAVDLNTNKTYEGSETPPVSIKFGTPGATNDGDEVRKIIIDAITKRVNESDYRNYKMEDWMKIIADISVEFIKNDPKLSNELDPSLFKAMINSLIEQDEIKEEIAKLIAEITKDAVVVKKSSGFDNDALITSVRSIFRNKGIAKRAFSEVSTPQVSLCPSLLGDRMRKAFASIK